MSKRNLTKLAQQVDLDEIEDALDEEEKPCRSTRSNVVKDTRGMNFKTLKERRVKARRFARRVKESGRKFLQE